MQDIRPVSPLALPPDAWGKRPLRLRSSVGPIACIISMAIARECTFTTMWGRAAIAGGLTALVTYSVAWIRNGVEA